MKKSLSIVVLTVLALSAASVLVPSTKADGVPLPPPCFDKNKPCPPTQLPPPR